MESNRPLGSIIGIDAAGYSPSVNPGRRASDPGNQTFAEVYDLAAYAASGSRKASRVDVTPGATLAPAAPSVLQAVPAEPISGLHPVDRAAADRLYLHLTTGGSWLRVTDDRSGTVTMRLHDADGAPVRELSITELAGGNGNGPEVA